MRNAWTAVATTAAIAGVAVQAANPVADPRVGGDARDRLPRRADAVEEDQPQPGHDQHQVERDDDRAALVQRIEAPPVQAIAQRRRPP